MFWELVHLSLNSTGPIPKRMRLSCNLVNVYTIAYHVQYTLHVCTRASLTDNLTRILARKSARVGRVDGQVGEDVRVGFTVGVGVSPMEFKLYSREYFALLAVEDECWKFLNVQRLYFTGEIGKFCTQAPNLMV